MLSSVRQRICSSVLRGKILARGKTDARHIMHQQSGKMQSARTVFSSTFLRSVQPQQLTTPYLCGRVQVRSFSRKDSANEVYGQITFFFLRAVARILGQGVSYAYRSGLYKQIPVKKLLMVLATPFVAGGAFFLVNSERVPYSDRLHYVWLDEEEELDLSEQNRRIILHEEQDRILPKEEEIYKVTWRIVNDMLDVCEEDGIISRQRRNGFNLNIIKSKIPNAFVLPDGSIFVYTGLLPIAETEAGLACVLGHEISHSLARHSSEKIGIVKALILLFEFVRGLSDHDRTFTAIFVEFLAGTIFQIGIPFAHSRAMEKEADRIGMKLAARAGYDPNQAAALWERMIASEEKPKILKQKKKEEEDRGWKDEPAPWENSVLGWLGFGKTHSHNHNHSHKHTASTEQTKSTPASSLTPAPVAAATTASSSGTTTFPTVAATAAPSAPVATPSTAVVTNETPSPTATPSNSTKVSTTPAVASVVASASSNSIVSAATSTQDMTMEDRFKELLSTHPCHARRVEDLQAYVSQVQEDFNHKIDILRLSGRPVPQSMRYLPYEGVKKREESPFDYDYGWDDRDFQSALVAQRCSALMSGTQGQQIEDFLKSIGRSKVPWGGGH